MTTNNDPIYVGDTITTTGTFTLVDHVTVADPTTITATTINPAATTTIYTYGTSAELTRTSTGIYVLTLTLSTAGLWRIGMTGTGAVSKSGIMSVHVLPLT